MSSLQRKSRLPAEDGRFREGLHPEALKFSSSLPIDKRLYREDIAGSIAHATMLAKQKILTASEAQKIRRALLEIQREIETGALQRDIGEGTDRFVAEDIHMAIEARLVEKLGEVGGKLHTGRSRNDQIALDERLFLRSAIQKITAAIRILGQTFIQKAEEYEDLVIPGYTHLQPAQPILLAHHLLAYVSMLERDYERFTDCYKRVNYSPLGAGALAGTSFPLDRNFTAKQLGFDGVVENSIDAVSDRDVQIEFLACCAITMMHVSRCAEELVLWNTQEFSLLEIGEGFATGSSIMPQKKNPDIAELLRGKTGRVYGNLVALLTVMKGLPLAYNRDMQEDKVPLFDSADTLYDSLTVCAAMLKSVRFHGKTMARHGDFLLATDLADYLARKGMPFREAHTLVGEIVRFSLEKGMRLREMSLRDYQKRSKLFTKDVFRLFDPVTSVSEKKSAGSTSPAEVKKALRFWKNKFK